MRQNRRHSGVDVFAVLHRGLPDTNAADIGDGIQRSGRQCANHKIDFPHTSLIFEILPEGNRPGHQADQHQADPFHRTLSCTAHVRLLPTANFGCSKNFVGF